MFKTAWLALFAVIFAPASAQGRDPLIGHWQGSMTKQGAVLPVSFNFSAAGKGLEGDFSCMDQAVMGYPLDSVTRAGSSLTWVLGGETSFSGKLDSGSISGSFKDPDGIGTFELHRSQFRPLPYGVKEVRFGSPNAILAGTLCIPAGKGKHPGIILLHGSGPQSRWGTLRAVADLFARRGIETLIWDQRGSGDSKGLWYRSTYDDLISDALAGIRLLQSRPEVAKEQVGVYGHSQGGTLSAVLPFRSKDVAFVIAGAPIVGAVYEQDLYRVRNGLVRHGFTSKEVADAMAFYSVWLNIARTGKGAEAIPREQEKVKGEKWFGWVEPPGKDSYIWSYYPPVGNFNTLSYWRHLRVPVLALYGERDEIEDVHTYALRIEESLKDSHNLDTTVLVLPRASHPFKVSNEPGRPFEWQHPSPGLYNLMIGWIKYRFGAH